MTFLPCRCGCTHAHGDTIHRIVAALATDDVDSALESGLLDSDACPGCLPACTLALLDARRARLAALAARERFRARQVRLHRHELERSQRRPAIAATRAPALPPAAAAALARAKDKAARRDGT